MKNRKGIHIHFGFGVLLLLLIVFYVLIKINAPNLGAGIDDALTSLSNSVTGLIPFTGS